METAMDKAALDRLAKVMVMTTSDHDGEALAAVRRANGILAKHKLRWPDVLLARGQAYRANEPDSNPAWMMSSEEEAKVYNVCQRGLSPAGKLLISSQAVTFLESIDRKLDQYAGAVYVSQKQWDWLGSIDEQLRRRGL